MQTCGIDHTGLAVRNLDDTTRFFTQALSWTESARDETCPRATVTDGTSRLTLWQVATDRAAAGFDRRHNIGLHHLAIAVPDAAALNALAARVAAHPGVTVEFLPESVGAGPRRHMMFTEPGGIRLELISPGP